jgi:hypothetical protein
MTTTIEDNESINMSQDEKEDALSVTQWTKIGNNSKVIQKVNNIIQRKRKRLGLFLTKIIRYCRNVEVTKKLRTLEIAQQIRNLRQKYWKNIFHIFQEQSLESIKEFSDVLVEAMATYQQGKEKTEDMDFYYSKLRLLLEKLIIKKEREVKRDGKESLWLF